ncbi:MAG: hypothetical protein P8Y99_09090, partial [Calditrichaceae bacterium]
MKSIIAFLIAILAFSSCNANSRTTDEKKPQKVYRIVYEMRSNDWYQQQAKLWKKEIEKNPASEEAWYNFYNANRYAHFEDIENKDKQAHLDKIIEDMGKAIPETYTFYLLKFWNMYSCEDLTLVEKAYAINPERPDTYYPFLSQAEVKGDTKTIKKFCTKLYESKDISPWLYEYNYNVLISVKPNAILFTNGDNDTYPAWILQQVHNVRPDVTVMNLSMCQIEKYLQNKLNSRGIKANAKEIQESVKVSIAGKTIRFDTKKMVNDLIKIFQEQKPEIPLCFALTVYNKYTEDISDELFIVGLAYQYSKERIDNIAQIKKNLENNMRLDHLKFDWYNENQLGIGMMHNMNMNYVVPMIMLAEHYKESGQLNKKEEWRDLAIEL